MGITGSISPRGSISGSASPRGSINGRFAPGGGGGNASIISDTTANWAAKTDLVSKKNTIYIWTDYKQNDQGQNIAGIKIGDGLAYVIDLPFIDELLYEHIYDTNIHVTLAEKMFWNNKNRAYADEDEEELILTAF